MAEITQTFKGAPLLNLRPDFKTLKRGQVDDFKFDSIGKGLATAHKETKLTRRFFPLPFILWNREIVKRMRIFRADRAGQRKGFWIPTYISDLWLEDSVSNGATTLVIKKSGYAEKHASNKQFRNVALVNKNTIQAFSIESVTVGASTETLNIVGFQSVSGDFNKENTVICELIYVRFKDKNLKYKIITDSVWRTAPSFIELPQETPDALTESPTYYQGVFVTDVIKVSRYGANYYFVDHAADVTIDGNVCGAADMAFGNIKSSLDMISEKARLSYGFLKTFNPFAIHLDPAFNDTTAVEVYDVSLDPVPVSFPPPKYFGNVNSVTPDKNGRYKVSLSSVLRIANRSATNLIAQRFCPFNLYSLDTCGVVRATFTTISTVDDFSMDAALPWVQVAGFGTKADNESDDQWFFKGKVKIGNETRECIGIDDTDNSILYLALPFTEGVVSVSVSVSASAGCDKKTTTCENKFNNRRLSIAMPGMPNSNPQHDGLIKPKEGGGKKG